MPEAEDLMRFPQIANTVENVFMNERGFLIENLDRAVAACVKNATTNGQKSSINLKISFEANDNNTVVIKAALDAKLPHPKAFPILAFVDRDGQLRTEDPRQQKLPGITAIHQGGAR